MRDVDMGNVRPTDAPIFVLIVSSTLFNLFSYKVLPSKFSPLIKSYIVSTLHALISVISVMRHLFVYEIHFGQMNRLAGGGVRGTGDELFVYNVCFSTGYLLYDLLLMCVHRSVRSASAIAHHLVIVLSFAVGLFTQVCHPCHYYFLAEELSTIPLNFKTIFRQNHRVHQLCSALFVLCFFVARLVYGSIICAYAFSAAPQFFRLAWNNDDRVTMWIGVGQGCLCLLTRGLNVYWAVLIARKVFAGEKHDKRP